MAREVLTVQQLLPMVQAEARRQGVPEEVAVSILLSENGDGKMVGHQVVKSDKISEPIGGGKGGAVGVMQVLPTTFADLKKRGLIPQTDSDLTDVSTNIRAGVAYMRDSMTQLSSADPTLLGIAYHSGVGGARAYQTSPQDFLKRSPNAAQYMTKISTALSTSGLMKRSDAAPDSFAAVVQQTDILTSLLQDAVRQVDAATPKAKELFDASNAANAKIAGAEAANSRTSLDWTTRVLGALGVDVTDPTSKISKEIVKRDQAQKDLESLLPQVQQAKSANMLLNPIGWLMGQVQLQQLQPKLDVAQTQLELSRSAIANYRAEANDAMQYGAKATKESINMMELGKVELAKAESQLKALQWDKEFASMKVRLVGEALSAKTSLFQLDAATTRLAAEKLGMARDDRAREDQQLEVDRANLALQFATGNKASFKSYLELKEFQQVPENRKLLQRIQLNGGSPGTYLGLVATYDSLPSIHKQDPVRGKFTESFLEAVHTEQQAKSPTGQPLYKGDALSQLDAAADAVYKRWRTEAETGDTARMSKDNPYRMQADVYSKAPKLAASGNSIAALVNSPEFKTAYKEVDESVILKEAAALVAANPERKRLMAQEVAEFFSEGRKFQQESMGLGMMGMKTVDSAYNVKGPREGLFTGGKPVNLVNAAELERALTLRALEHRRTQAPFQQYEDIAAQMNAQRAAPAVRKN